MRDFFRALVFFAFVMTGAPLPGAVDGSIPMLESLSPDDEFGYEYSFAFGEENRGILAWHTVYQGNNCVQYARYCDGLWSSPGCLSESVVYSYLPQVAMDRYGDSCVIWLENHKCEVALRGAEIPVEGGIEFYTMPVVKGRIRSPCVARSLSGFTVVVWNRVDGKNSTIECFLFEKNQSESSEQTLSSPDCFCSDPQVIMDAQGNATVAWIAKKNGESFLQARQIGSCYCLEPLFSTWSNEKHCLTEFCLRTNGLDEGYCFWIEKKREDDWCLKECMFSFGAFGREEMIRSFSHPIFSVDGSVGAERKRIVVVNSPTEILPFKNTPPFGWKKCMVCGWNWHHGEGPYPSIQHKTAMDLEGNTLLFYRVHNVDIDDSDRAIQVVCFFPEEEGQQWRVPYCYQYGGILDRGWLGKEFFISWDRDGSALLMMTQREGERQNLVSWRESFLFLSQKPAQSWARCHAKPRK